MRKLLVGLVCLLSPLAWAQDPEEPVPIEIMMTRPESIWVVPGGQPDVVRLYGRGFEMVRDVKVQQNGSNTTAVKARLKMVSQGIADLEVQAAPNAEPGDNYRMIFFTPLKSYPMEQVPFEVANPQE